MLDELDTHHGLPRTFYRYDDCISLYKNQLHTIIGEYPFRIVYDSEKAVDTGGVSQDMFSGFWEIAYVKNFDGSNTLIPTVHPHTDISQYKVLGSMISHGCMSCGFLPIRLAFPFLAYALLGCDITIPDELLIDSFI